MLVVIIFGGYYIWCSLYLAVIIFGSIDRNCFLKVDGFVQCNSKIFDVFNFGSAKIIC